MAYYSKEEQETDYIYDAVAGQWRVYSTYPPHIKSLLDRVDSLQAKKDKDGRVVQVAGYVDKEQIRLYRK
ncbi:hypothetical protein QNH47_06235 [Virgibacillus halodenitrificans]|uniref:hypothetical protein n=1 Tax=Virgibacillus halodenitrificans TaxID=1482 RepID=UPI0024BF96BA|nr:hypothetical protein [Virgibacillus halodenitrificans]WHX27451.1 hypothetical protein QNH47_06235 [Virgibacillus halodenitrificans]